MKVTKTDFKMIKDPRGWSVDVFKKSLVPLNVKCAFLINSDPGTVRGNHYHKLKNEWLCIFKGRARLSLMDNKTKKKASMILSEKKISLVYIRPNTVHAVSNIGKGEISILEFSDREFNPKKPDTFRVQIV